MKNFFSLLISTLTTLLLSPAFFPVVQSTTFTIVNNCNYTVWPGTFSYSGEPPLPTTGFSLEKNESTAISATSDWSGRFWGRTYCSQNSTGKFSCITGDCGSGEVQCSGGTATPPATLAEFKLDAADSDFYDVSLVDGYNLPMMIVPARKNCTRAGCTADLNGSCPLELQVTSAGQSGTTTVACRSACDAFEQSQYCCTGTYNSRQTCKPTSYSKVFKSACPTAYSYVYDDASSTFTCPSADYVITFCPQPNNRHSAPSPQPRLDILSYPYNVMMIRGASFLTVPGTLVVIVAQRKLLVMVVILAQGKLILGKDKKRSHCW